MDQMTIGILMGLGFTALMALAIFLIMITTLKIVKVMEVSYFFKE